MRRAPARRPLAALATLAMAATIGVTAISMSAAQAASDNLSLGAGADGSSKASGTSYGNVKDGSLSTYWSPSGSTGSISIKWGSRHDGVVGRHRRDLGRAAGSARGGCSTPTPARS